MGREKPRRIGWWRRYLWNIPCSSSASPPVGVSCLINACWFLIRHNLSRRLRNSPISIQSRNKLRFGKYYWLSCCRMWFISSEPFGGPQELFIKYRLAIRMTNRYHGTLLEDYFYFFAFDGLLFELSSLWVCSGTSHLIESVKWSKCLLQDDHHS